MRSVTPITSSITCSTSRMVMPRLRSFTIRSRSCAISSLFIPAAGSSSSRSRGRVASARASSSRRCSPNERLAASSSWRAARPENSSSWAISPRTPLCPPSQRATKPRSARSCGEFCATHRFCHTLSWPKRRMFWKVRAIPSCRRLWVGKPARFVPLKTISPDVSGNRPVTTFTAVLLPEPFGPIRPTISPSFTSRSSPSTALTPPKWRAARRSSSTAAPAIFTKQSLGPEIHRQNDQRAEQQVAPVAEVAQALDQERLHEDHRGEGAEDAVQAADDRVGDGEGRHQHVEVVVLDVRRVVREDAAADAGDGAADGHRAHLDRGQVDAHRLRRQLVLAHGPQHRTVARAVEPPQQRHDEDDEHPDEQHHLGAGPAVLREEADLAEPLRAQRSELDLALGDLVVEIEEEQAHRFAEGERGDDQHESLDAQRGEAHRAGGHRAEQRARAERRHDVPAGEHREHSGGVRADGEERRLRHADLPGEQHDVGGKAEQGVHPDDLRKAEVELHWLYRPPDKGVASKTKSALASPRDRGAKLMAALSRKD